MSSQLDLIPYFIEEHPQGVMGDVTFKEEDPEQQESRVTKDTGALLRYSKSIPLMYLRLQVIFVLNDNLCFSFIRS